MTEREDRIAAPYDWNDAYLENLDNPVHISIHNEGLFALHNLTCWLCDKESAVYRLGPDWCFYPCRTCQTKYVGAWTVVQPWWKRLIDRARREGHEG